MEIGLGVEAWQRSSAGVLNPCQAKMLFPNCLGTL